MLNKHTAREKNSNRNGKSTISCHSTRQQSFCCLSSFWFSFLAHVECVCVCVFWWRCARPFLLSQTFLPSFFHFFFSFLIQLYAGFHSLTPKSKIFYSHIYHVTSKITERITELKGKEKKQQQRQQQQQQRKIDATKKQRNETSWNAFTGEIMWKKVCNGNSTLRYDVKQNGIHEIRNWYIRRVWERKRKLQ